MNPQDYIIEDLIGLQWIIFNDNVSDPAFIKKHISELKSETEFRQYGGEEDIEVLVESLAMLKPNQRYEVDEMGGFLGSTDSYIDVAMAPWKQENGIRSQHVMRLVGSRYFSYGKIRLQAFCYTKASWRDKKIDRICLE